MPLRRSALRRSARRRPALSLSCMLALVLVALSVVPAAVPAVAHAVAHAARSRDGAPDVPSCSTQGAAPYLHTCGPFIEDAGGQPVRLLAVNWYGFEANDFVAAGLDRQSYRDVIALVKSLGYNTLRIPFSNEMVETNPVVSQVTQTCPQGAPHTACRPINGQSLLGANSDLYGLTSLQILKTIVDYAAAQGLYVILDDHRSRAGWAAQENGLWYDDPNGYSQSAWLTDWQRVVAFFAGDSALTGVDLWNEPHSFGHPTDCASYLSGHGASWGACGGQTNPATDWRAAAQLAGNAILAANPNLLVVVEGTSLAPSATGGFDSSDYGTSLGAAGAQPVHLNAPNRLVYSVHEYEWHQGPADVPTMLSRWSRLFGYLMDPTKPYATPVWIGEFGTCNTDPSCVLDSTPGSQGYWFDALVRYFNTAPYPNGPTFGWSLWALDGTSPDAYDFVKGKWARRNGDLEPYGLLNTAWSDQGLPDLEGELFNANQFDAAPTATPTDAPLPTDAPTDTPTPTPLASATSRPTAMPTAVSPLTVTASGSLAQGRVRFDLLARRDRGDHLSGLFPYADHVHHLAVQAGRIDGVSVQCGRQRVARVTGTARDGRGHGYRFAVSVGAASRGRLLFTLRLSNGFQFAGVATGSATIPCAAPAPVGSKRRVVGGGRAEKHYGRRQGAEG